MAAVMIPIHIHDNCAVAMIQVELSSELLTDFSHRLLDTLNESRTKGAVLDLSGVRMIDRYDRDALTRLFAKCELMGAKVVVCGLRPTVVSSLVSEDLSFGFTEAFHTLDDAIAYLNKSETNEQKEYSGIG